MTMDLLYGHDRKLSDFEDPDMADILETDMFQSSSMVSTPLYAEVGLAADAFHMFIFDTNLKAQQN